MPKTPRLREWRARAALSQEELRDLSSVSRATIADLEAGNRGAQPRTIRKLAEALDIEPDDLYGVPEYPLTEAPPSPEQPPLNGFEEEWRWQQGGAVSELWQLGLAVLYREIAKKGRTAGERLKAGQLEDLTELEEFGAASAVLAKLRGPRDIRGHEPDELAEAIDDFEAADTDIQAVLRQDLFADHSQEQRQQLAEFRRKRSEISSAAELQRRPADAS